MILQKLKAINIVVIISNSNVLFVNSICDSSCITCAEILPEVSICSCEGSYGHSCNSCNSCNNSYKFL